MIGRRLRAGGLAGTLALVLAPAATSAAAPPPAFFGVDPQGWLDADDYARMGAAGVGTLRFQLSWPAIDPGPATDDYDWSSPDAIVAGAAQYGIRALPFAIGAPAWAVGDSGPPVSPPALAAWRGFLAAAVDRYGPGGEFWATHPSLPRMPIRDWQIWNEENSPTYWQPRPDVREYARLLAASHDAITGRDPGAKVILGGMFGTPFGGQKPGIAAWRFLGQLYRIAGARRDFDAVAPHPYAARLAEVRDQIARLRRRMERAGDERAELWVTEIGWASGGAPHPLNRGTAAGQATRLRAAFRYLLRNRRALNLENVTWYSWRDNTDPAAALCAWCPESGLLMEDGTAKPALGAFMEFAGGR